MLLNVESMQPMTSGMVMYPLSCGNVWQLGEGGSECFFVSCFSAFHHAARPSPNPKMLRLNMSLVRSVARAIMGREAVQG